MARQPVEAALSATILLIRDGSAGALEVFMVERHHRIDFATGALVFPGGKCDPGDADPGLRRRCRGVEGLDNDAVAVRIGAIRETFEECGVLLASPRGSDELVSAERLVEIKARHQQALESHALDMRVLAEQEELDLSCDRLVHFAHWITPLFMPKRFDTHFFLVAAPADQLAVHDGKESVDSLWTSVDDARDDQREGRRTIIFPTLMNLAKLGQSRNVAEALATADAAPVVPVLPRLERDADGNRTLHLPPEAGYDLSWAPLESVEGGLPR